MTEELRIEIIEAIEAANVACPEQVADAVLAIAEAGGDWRAEIAATKSREPVVRRGLGIDVA